MANSFYALIAVSLLGQGSYPVEAPPPAGTVLPPSLHAAPAPLPFPGWAPLCKRLQATTTVWQAPIPMPLDILSEYPSTWQRWRIWRAAHRPANALAPGHGQ